ncbi:MAG TPA: cytochrome d ubiquinol oxidase subunit II, partial [Candidatus Nanopelagicaceae bacterium]
LSLTSKGGVIAGSTVVVVAWLAALAANAKGREGFAFLFSAIATAAVVITLFTGLYPNVMPNLTPGGVGLTIFNASSTHYTLGVMTWVAVIMTPIVLIYQGWSYWVFRKRIHPNQIASPESGVLDIVH